jgi:hypothetical protein
VRLSAWAEVRGPRVLRPKYVMGPGRERAWNTARCSPRVEVEPILRVGIGRHVRRVSAAKVEVNAWPTWPRPMRYSVVRVI